MIRRALILLFLPSLAFAQISKPTTAGGGSASSSIVAGTTVVTGCTDGWVLFNDAGVVGCDAGLIYAKSTDILTMLGGSVVGSTTTAATATQTQLATVTGASATSNWYNLTGTFPTSLTNPMYGVNWTITTAGSSAQPQAGLFVSLAAGYTGTNMVTGAQFQNAAVSTGGFTNIFTLASSTIGVVGTVSAGTSAVGVFGRASGGTQGIGVLGSASGATTNVGVMAVRGAAPTVVATALQADNGGFATPIAVFTDNAAAIPTNAATQSAQILDGGQIQCGNCVLTSGTMTATNQAEERTTTHRYDFTNAMVTALGAGLTGDITVATVPANTRVDKALLYVDTACGGPTTLTMSIGDAVGGTPFINYIVPSDIKAVANTVYGDAAAGTETGTSLFDATAKWLQEYIPSVTATTLVSAHLIATVTNLNTATTCTGHILLTTTKLP